MSMVKDGIRPHLLLASVMWDKSCMAQPAKLSPDAGPVAREVHRRMVMLGLNQKALAITADLNETYVRDLFKGRSKNPKTEQLNKLASALGCATSDLTHPGSSGSDHAAGQVVDLTGIFPLHPSEVALINMWRHLERPGRDQILMRISAMIPDQPRRRKPKDI